MSLPQWSRCFHVEMGVAILHRAGRRVGAPAGLVQPPLASGTARTDGYEAVVGKGSECAGRATEVLPS